MERVTTAGFREAHQVDCEQRRYRSVLCWVTLLQSSVCQHASLRLLHIRHLQTNQCQAVMCHNDCICDSPYIVNDGDLLAV